MRDRTFNLGQKPAVAISIALLLILATAAAYWPAVSCQFVDFDDYLYVYENNQVLSGWNWGSWKYAWTTYDCGNWHPLTWLSLELDAALWGPNPAGFHATNLALHIVNSLLVGLLLSRLMGQFDRSCCVAFLFALHPLHVESVAWVSERKDVLSTLFLLLSLLAYEKYSRRPTTAWYFCVLCLYAMGLLSKPMLVTEPILLFLLDWWPLHRFAGAQIDSAPSRYPQRAYQILLLEKVPLLLLAALEGLATLNAQASAGAIKSLGTLPVGHRIANSFAALLWYVWKTLWPTNLAALYLNTSDQVAWQKVLLGLLLLIVMTFLGVRFRRTRPHVTIGWTWFLISLMPVIGLVQVGSQVYADRYTYVPHFGLLLLIVWECFNTLGKSRVGWIACCSVFAASSLACGIMTHSQIAHWRTSEALWTRMLELFPGHPVACANLARIYQARGQHERAIQFIEAGIPQTPIQEMPQARYRWGQSLVALDRPDEAIEQFLAVLKIQRDHKRAIEELMKLLRQQNRLAELAQLTNRYVSVLEKYCQHHPDDSPELLRLGLLLAQRGDLPKALTFLVKATRRMPESAPALTSLAHVQFQLGQLAEAKQNFFKALALNPDLAGVHFRLAEIFEQEHNFGEAEKHLSETVRLNPEDAAARQRLEQLKQHR